MLFLTKRRVCMQLLLTLLAGPAMAQENPAGQGEEPRQTEDRPQDGTPSGTSQDPNVSGRELTIQEAIERTVDRGLTVEQATAERDAQKEAKRRAFSLIGPSVQVRYQHAFYKNELSQGSTLFRDAEEKRGSLIALQPLTGLYAGLKNAQITGLGEERANEGLKLAKIDAALQGAGAFLQAYGAQEQVAIAEASLAAAKSAYNDAKAMQRVGRLNQADLLKFELALSQAETRAVQARAAKVVAFAYLAQTIRLDANDKVQLKRDLPSPAILPTDGNDEEIAKNRPELRQAEITAEMASAQRNALYSAFVPSVNAFAQVDRNFGELTGPVAEEQTKYYGIQLQWELWNNGGSVFAIREAGARSVQARSLATQTRDAVHLDILQSRENYKAAQESLKQADAGVAQADEAYRIDQIRFKSGQISATDLIQSEAMRTNARGLQVNARTEFLTWHLRLQKSLGAELPKL